jgi:hypothetical protein
MRRPRINATGLSAVPPRLVEGLGFVLVLVVGVVDDPQDLDEAEGRPQPAQGRFLVGVDLGHGVGRLPPWRLVAAGPQVQVDPVALELELIDLALAVVLAVMPPLVPGLGADRLAPAGSVTPVLAGRRQVACLAADLSSSCRHRPGPPSSLA